MVKKIFRLLNGTCLKCGGTGVVYNYYGPFWGHWPDDCTCRQKPDLGNDQKINVTVR